MSDLKLSKEDAAKLIATDKPKIIKCRTGGFVGHNQLCGQAQSDSEGCGAPDHVLCVHKIEAGE